VLEHKQQDLGFGGLATGTSVNQLQKNMMALLGQQEEI
jgi:hypothetical protein